MAMVNCSGYGLVSGLIGGGDEGCKGSWRLRGGGLIWL